MNGFYLDSRGEFFSAKIQTKGTATAEIKPLKSRQFLSMGEQLSLSSKGVSVAIHASYVYNHKDDMENVTAVSNNKGSTLHENSDKEWLYSVIGTNIKRVLPDYQALANLLTLLPQCDTALLLFEEDARLKTILIVQNEVVAVDHFHLQEVQNVGLSPLLERLRIQYTELQVCSNLPNKTVLIGPVSKDINYSVEHFWKTVSLSHLKAAGATVKTAKEHLIQLHRKRNILRYTRRLLTAVSIVMLATTVGTTYTLKKRLSALKNQSSQPLFSASELQEIDSLAKITSELQSQASLVKEHHQWDLLLRKLGLASKKHTIVVDRLASKNNDNTIELLIRGSGKNEKSVNMFISTLESYSQIKTVTLSQIDKQDNEYRFSLQCLTTI